MIAWMLYSLLVAVLLSLAAHAVDRVVRLRGRATRWVWVACLGATLVVPLVFPRMPRSTMAEPAAFVPATFAVPLDALVTDASAAPAWPLPRVLLAVWLLLTGLLVLYGVFAALRLQLARRRWSRGELAGEPVLISADVGPAVVGLIDPAVVVPAWASTLTPGEQRMILAHEHAHIAARDPWLVTLAWLLPAALPWNPLLWWQARRLREAIELDCDARLLSGSDSPVPYAELLLSVGSRTAAAPLAVAALTEPRSLLEKRIRRMFERRPHRPVLRAAAWAVVALLAAVGTVQAPLPGEPLPRPLAAAEQTVEAIASGAVSSVSIPSLLIADTVKPRLMNRTQVDEAIQLYYPPLLRDAGIKGVPQVQLYINERGEVAVARVSRSSGHTALDEAALRVVGVMRFSPAQVNARAVSMWFEVPVQFADKAGASAAAREVDAAAARLRETSQELRRAGSAEQTKSAFTEAPVLNNRAEIAAAVNRLYPSTLRSSGIGGRTIVSFLINEKGEVEKAELKSSSGLEELDDAAMQLAPLARFTPGRRGETAAKGWIDLPIDFNAEVPEPRSLPRVQPGGDQSAGPTFTPYTVKPELTNMADVSRALQKYYPAELRDAGVGGTTNLWFFINEQGRVTKVAVKTSSGTPALDEAAMEVASVMQFTPARNRDQVVKVWVDMPIVFKSKEPESSATGPSL